MYNTTFNKSACTLPCMWRSLCTLASVSRLFVQLLQSALTNTTWKKNSIQVTQLIYLNSTMLSLVSTIHAQAKLLHVKFTKRYMYHVKPV